MTGWGKYLPRQKLTNAELESKLSVSDDWIVQRTGIKERRIAGPDDFTSTMSTAAAKEALKMAGLGAADLDLIIVCTTTPDYFTPPVSSMVQHQLGADCPAFTLVNGCTGWLYGLATATQFISNGVYDSALIVGVEIISRYIDYGDRTTSVLFGDGAGAAVLQASEDPTGILAFDMGSDGSKSDALILPGGGTRHAFTQKPYHDELVTLKMNGSEVFKFAARIIKRSLNSALEQANMTADEIDLYIPHQSNYRITEAAARFMRLPLERFYSNIHRYGNTSAATIPIALCEAVEEGRCKVGDTLGFVSFGAGLTWASTIFHLGGPVKPVEASKVNSGKPHHAEEVAELAPEPSSPSPT